MMTISTPEASRPSGQTIVPKIDVSQISVPKKGATIIPLPTAKPPFVASGEDNGGEEGKGGEIPPSTAFALTNADFLATIFADALKEGQALVTAKRGDPQEGGWIAHPASKAETLCSSDLNTYFNCASFTPGEDGALSARKEQVAGYHVLVLDDVGTKADRNLLGGITPTWELETSPGNFQIGFKLDPPLYDGKEVDRFQRVIATAGLTDNGALGIARWVRLPNGINGKPKYAMDGKPFACRLHAWNPETAYASDDLLKMLVPLEAQTEPAATASPRPIAAAMPRPSNDVYIARGSENPVVAAFKSQGLYKRLIAAGRHDVTCPWVEEHTDKLDTGAAYFEPTQDYPKGGFRCQHSHGDKYHIREVLERFGLSDSEARNRSLIRTAAGEMNRIHAAAEEILVANGNIYQSGGVLVTVSSDPVTGDAQIVPISESALTLALSASCDWEKFDGRKQDWVRCDPPQRHVSMLYKAQTYQHIPPLKGLARQPYYQEGSGELVSTSGYNSTAQRLGVFDPAKFPKPAATEAAAREALGLLQDLIGEFHFAEDVDRIAALSAMFTAVTRPSLGLAPAYHVDAPSSGSGKSYLCETIAAFAGPGSSSRVSYPKTSEEATKSVLSLLMSAPGGNPAAQKETKKAIPTYAVLAQQHLDHAKTYQKRPENTDSVLKNHILPRWGKLRLDEIKQRDIAKWFAEKREAGLSPSTIEKIRVIFNRSFELAAQWEIPGGHHNPVRGVPRKKFTNARERFLTAEESDRLIKAASASLNSQLGSIVALLLYTGARKTELLHATWAHVDIERRKWYIPDTKTGKPRFVPLSQAALDVIGKLPKWEKCPWLLPNPETRKPYTDIKRPWDTVREAAGLPGLRIHDLRHSAASFMINAGIDLYTVGRVLGHADHQSTMRYSHLTNDTLLAAVEAGAAKMGVSVQPST